MGMSALPRERISVESFCVAIFLFVFSKSVSARAKIIVRHVSRMDESK
jgi:hypothetical protein